MKSKLGKRQRKFSGIKVQKVWSRALTKYRDQKSIAEAMGHSESTISMWKRADVIALFDLNHLILLC